jgi:hypothetical protein
MTTRQTSVLVSMAAFCLLFTSCVDSKVPLSDPNMSQADERLAGNWRLRNDDGSVNNYRFVRAGDKFPASVMRVAGSSRKPDGTTEQFASLLLFPTTIGEKTYLNVTEGTDPKVKLVEEKGWTAETVNIYWIYRYQVTGDVLTVQGIDGDAKKRFIEAGKIKGKIEKGQDGNTKVYFNDTTENLVKFVAEAGDDLFSKDVVRLERVK